MKMLDDKHFDMLIEHYADKWKDKSWSVISDCPGLEDDIKLAVKQNIDYVESGNTSMYCTYMTDILIALLVYCYATHIADISIDYIRESADKMLNERYLEDTTLWQSSDWLGKNEFT